MKHPFILFAFAALVLPFVSLGQCCPYINGMTVYPTNPSSTDDLTIEYTVTTPNLGAFLGETHYIDGDTVVINACYFVGLATALQTFVESITVAPLPAGDYFMRLHAMESSDPTQCIPYQSNDSVFSFSVAAGGAMPICDSVFISPDTVYVQQGVDTAVTVSLTYTGNTDVSYSMISFVFNDSTFIDINDFAVTNGIAGPYTFTWDYDLIYNQASVPNNTVVPAQVWIYHDAVGGPAIDCKLPIMFIVNSETAVVPRILSDVAIYPNPVQNDLVITGIEPGSRVSLLDVTGKTRVEQIATGNNLSLNVESLTPGIYFLTVKNANSVAAQRVVKL